MNSQLTCRSSHLGQAGFEVNEDLHQIFDTNIFTIYFFIIFVSKLTKLKFQSTKNTRYGNGSMSHIGLHEDFEEGEKEDKKGSMFCCCPLKLRKLNFFFLLLKWRSESCIQLEVKDSVQATIVQITRLIMCSYFNFFLSSLPIKSVNTEHYFPTFLFITGSLTFDILYFASRC